LGWFNCSGIEAAMMESQNPMEKACPAPLGAGEAANDALARLYGEPVLELPRDLYIPPDALRVFLDAFEGPLDLLLYLIRRANINVLDIPMAPLTVQYLEYVEAMRASNLELAAEYLLMAAMLLEIKSRMLLPRPPREDAIEIDPRAELVRRLLEYEQTKLAAARLDALPRAGRDFEKVGVFVTEKIVERMPEVSLHDLQLAWLRLMKRARLVQHHRVEREKLSVREHMTLILRKLHGGAFVVFDTLFDLEKGPAGLVVSFLAMLELVKETLVVVTQNEAFAPIYVKLADSEH
jgi:segregation and condensation protein A